MSWGIYTQIQCVRGYCFMIYSSAAWGNVVPLTNTRILSIGPSKLVLTN